jgi:hypothetical protein
MMPSAPVSRPASFWHSLSTPLKLQNWRFATGSSNAKKTRRAYAVPLSSAKSSIMAPSKNQFYITKAVFLCDQGLDGLLYSNFRFCCLLNGGQSPPTSNKRPGIYTNLRSNLPYRSVAFE